MHRVLLSAIPNPRLLWSLENKGGQTAVIRIVPARVRDAALRPRTPGAGARANSAGGRWGEEGAGRRALDQESRRCACGGSTTSLTRPQSIGAWVCDNQCSEIRTSRCFQKTRKPSETSVEIKENEWTWPLRVGERVYTRAREMKQDDTCTSTRTYTYTLIYGKNRVRSCWTGTQSEPALEYKSHSKTFSLFPKTKPYTMHSLYICRIKNHFPPKITCKALYALEWG